MSTFEVFLIIWFAFAISNCLFFYWYGMDEATDYIYEGTGGFLSKVAIKQLIISLSFLLAPILFFLQTLPSIYKCTLNVSERRKKYHRIIKERKDREL